jgi:hypothetical protein
MQFNMTFGESNDLAEPEDDELPSDDWFEEELITIPPPEDEPEKLLPPFEERPLPEYEACADTWH